MNRILDKRVLAPEITLLEVEAPRIQKRWKPGMFVILRPLADSERIPLTLVAGDAVRQSVTLVIQSIGATTKELARLEPGDSITDLVGPLGEAATMSTGERVVCLGGGVGTAELLPVARAFKEAGNHVTALVGARSDNYRILDRELREGVDVLEWATDDGSFGFHGNVIQMLTAKYAAGAFTEGHVIGPIPMMKAAAEATRGWGMKMHASLNPVMIDGTGMCGGCRVTVGGQVKFACVDGPEFDAYQVDFDELARRNKAYRTMEQQALERHICRLTGTVTPA
jgi:ferredoxin/flavodoxin---NADP+ reductase